MGQNSLITDVCLFAIVLMSQKKSPRRGNLLKTRIEGYNFPAVNWYMMKKNFLTRVRNIAQYDVNRLVTFVIPLWHYVQKGVSIALIRYLPP